MGQNTDKKIPTKQGYEIKNSVVTLKTSVQYKFHKYSDNGT